MALPRKKNALRKQRPRVRTKSDTEERYRLVVQASNDGIWDWDIDSGSTFFSDRWSEMLGYSATELESSMEERLALMHPEDLKKAQALMTEHFEKGTPFVHISRFFHKDRTIRWILCKAIALRDSTGRPYRMVGAHTDITESKQAEERLQNMTDRLMIALKSLKLGSWEYFPEENRVIWDDTMFEIYGVDPKTFTGKLPEAGAFVLPEDSKRVWAEINESLKNGRTYRSEFRINHPKSGIRFIGAAGVVNFDANGKPSRYVGVNWDMTDEKNQELKLLQASKMSTLGEMAGGIAHEVNNPLSIIMGRVAQMRKLMEEPELNKEAFRKTFDQIEKTCERISKIIRGLRTFSRNGESDPMEPVVLYTLIEETIDLCRERFKNAQVDLKFDVAPHLLLFCRPVQVSQVILNLLNNAFDAISDLPSKWIEVKAVKLKSGTEISVTDSGSGIPKEKIDLIMRPFFTTKEVGKGTGLGLSIADGIVKDHGGLLRVDGDSPHTRFVIFIPDAIPASETIP